MSSLLHDLWFCLEGGEDDNKILSPRIKENRIEKTLQKVIKDQRNIKLIMKKSIHRNSSKVSECIEKQNNQIED